jgi:hypothetical protein
VAEPNDTIWRVNSGRPMTVPELQHAAGVLNLYAHTGDPATLSARQRVEEQLGLPPRAPSDAAPYWSDQASATFSSPRKPLVLRWQFWATLLTACALLVAGAAYVANRNDPSSTGAPAATSERAPESVAAAPNSRRNTAPEAPQPPAVAEPTVFTGTGDTVVPITKPGGASGTVLATITGNDAGSHFAVQGVDGDQDLLVNTTDPYSGTVLMDADTGGTTQLQVSASGPWSIALADPLTAPRLAMGANTGTGDAVFRYEGPRGIAQIDGNAGGRHFGVVALTGDGNDLLVNTTDPYSGSVPMPPGPGFLTVSAEGNWSIVVS